MHIGGRSRDIFSICSHFVITSNNGTSIINLDNLSYHRLASLGYCRYDIVGTSIHFIVRHICCCAAAAGTDLSSLQIQYGQTPWLPNHATANIQTWEIRKVNDRTTSQHDFSNYLQNAPRRRCRRGFGLGNCEVDKGPAYQILGFSSSSSDHQHIPSTWLIFRHLNIPGISSKSKIGQ
jgi:hypothetical protein